MMHVNITTTKSGWPLSWVLLGWFAVAYVLVFVFADVGFDDTDPPGGRSHMLLRTDAGTGCQYLGGIFGSLTPRLDGQGKQMGCRR